SEPPNLNQASLTFRDRQFYLNGVKFQILSGAIHYFRVPQDYWRDRLLKLKAAGFNTVETYAPWNLHEDTKGNFNFNGMLNVRKFFKLAQELGLYVIFRPGPFICSEWEFGGMPGWLLSDPNMRVRSMYMGFTQAAEDYLRVVINEVADLQMSRGGPIIAFQVENEYGSYGDNGRYLQHLADSMRRSGVVEALFTSDGDEGIRHAKPLAGAFAGINYNSKAHAKWLQSIVISLPDLVDSVTSLLDQGASINLYMFHGGTNFGFMNGYNGITGSLLITSYDYDAPLSENGQPTEKYHRIRELMLARLSKTAVKSLPDIPAPIPTKDYGSWPVKWTMHWDKLVEMVDKTTMSETLKFMEEVHSELRLYSVPVRF
uniref:Glyco_hydro_35 domain-containing protein n=1 Tax=Macrostomum lignano TaxID=282301 RepID=A0A1I8IYY1_9PLAT